MTKNKEDKNVNAADKTDLEWITPGIALPKKLLDEDKNCISSAVKVCVGAGDSVAVYECLKEKLNLRGCGGDIEEISEYVAGQLYGPEATKTAKDELDKALAKIPYKKSSNEYKNAEIKEKANIFGKYYDQITDLKKGNLKGSGNPTSTDIIFPALSKWAKQIRGAYKARVDKAISASQFFGSGPLTRPCPRSYIEQDGNISNGGSANYALVPFGYGPGCETSKEIGELRFKECYHKLKEECIKTYLIRQLQILQKVYKRALIEHKERLKLQEQLIKNTNRGNKGIAESIPFKDLPINIGIDASQIRKCMQEKIYKGQTQRDPSNSTKNNAGGTSGINANNLLSNLRKDEEDAKKKFCQNRTLLTDTIPLEPISEERIKGQSGGLDSIKHILGDVIEGVGATPGEISECVCTKCIVVGEEDNITGRGDFKKEESKNSIDKKTKQDDDLISTNETFDENIIPYIIGKTTIPGKIISSVTHKIKVCKKTVEKFDVRIKLSANRVKLLEIIQGNKRYTDEIEHEVNYTKDGHTIVDLYGVPKLLFDGYNLNLLFTVEEIYIDNLEEISSSKPYSDFIYYETSKEIYAVNASSGNIVILDARTLEEKQTAPITINTDTSWSVTPEGDIVWQEKNSNIVYKWCRSIDKTTSLQTTFNGNGKGFAFTIDGWVDYTKYLPYYYDTVRGNPAVELNTWIPWTNYIKGCSSVMAFPVGLENSADHSFTWSAHVLEYDFIENQSYYNSNPFRRWTLGSLNGTIKTEYGTHIFIETSGNNIWLSEFAYDYVLEEAPLILTGIYPQGNFEGKRKTGFPKLMRYGFKIDQFFESGYFILFNDKTHKLYVFNLNKWFVANVNRGVLKGPEVEYKNPRHMDQKSFPLPASPIFSPFIVSQSELHSETFCYVDNSGNIVKINSLNDTYDIIGTTTNIPSNKQVCLKDSVIWLDTNGKLRTFVSKQNKRFNVSRGIGRLFSYIDLYSEVHDDVYCYLDGFAVFTDKLDSLLKNLFLLTGVKVYINYGVAHIYNYENTLYEFNSITYYNSWEKREKRKPLPTTEYSFLHTLYGERRRYFIQETSDYYVELTTNTSTTEPKYPALNAQRLYKEIPNTDNISISYQTGLLYLFDDVTIDVTTGNAEVEHFNKKLQLYEPPTTAKPISYISHVRPIILFGEEFDNTLQTDWVEILEDMSGCDGYIIVKGNTTLTKLQEKGCILGTRNYEFIKFSNVTQITSDTFKLENLTRRYMFSGPSIDFHEMDTDYLSKQYAHRNAGIFIVIDPPESYEDWNTQFIAQRISVSQRGIDIEFPVQERLFNKYPSPYIRYITKEKISVGGGASTGKYLIAMWWSDRRDIRDGLYIYNSINNNGEVIVEDINTNICNKFTWCVVAKNEELQFPNDYKHPVENCIDELETAYKIKLYNDDIPKEMDKTKIDGGWWLFPNTIASEVKELTGDIDANFFDEYHQILTNYVHPRHAQWMKRVMYPYYLGWQETHEGIINAFQDIIENMPRITQLWDYWGSPSKNPLKVIYPNKPNLLTMDGWPPSIGQPSAILPLRHAIGYFIYPYTRINFEIKVIPDSGEYYNYHDKTTLWFNTSVPIQENFAERMFVIRSLLDQFYSVPDGIPPEAKPFLEKYGFKGPYSIAAFDADGERITDFFVETFKLWYHYQTPLTTKNLNILVAEVQDDGSLGHFSIYTDVEVEDKGFDEREYIIYPDFSTKNTKSTAYALIDTTAVYLSNFSLSLVIKDEPALFNSKVQKSTNYIIIDSNSTRNHKISGYSLLTNDKQALYKLCWYVILK